MVSKLAIITLTWVAFAINPLMAEKVIVAKPADSRKEDKRIERIRQVLEYGNSQQVRDILKLKVLRLKEADQKKLLPSLKKLVKSEDLLIQAAIARYAGRVEYTDLDADVASLLVSEHIEVEGAVVGAVEKKKITAAVPFLKQKIEKADFTEQDQYLGEFIRVLGVLGNKEMVPFFFEKLKDDTVLTHYKGSMIGYFGRAETQDPAVVKYLTDLMKNEEGDIKIRPHAASALGVLNVTAAAGDMRAVLKKIDEISDLDKKRKFAKLRLHLLGALVRLKDKEVVKVLYIMARDDDFQVRLGAIRQLGRLKEKGALEMLQFKAKHDPDAKVRRAAEKAIENINGKSTKKGNGKTPGQT